MTTSIISQHNSYDCISTGELKKNKTIVNAHNPQKSIHFILKKSLISDLQPISETSGRLGRVSSRKDVWNHYAERLTFAS